MKNLFLLIVSLFVVKFGVVFAAPDAFNPKSKDFGERLIAAKTFATWCGYCRQGLEAEAKSIASGEKIRSDERVVEVIIVTPDQYLPTLSFLKKIGLQKKVMVVTQDQLDLWKVELFPTTLLFQKGRLLKAVVGETPKEVIWKEIDLILPPLASGTQFPPETKGNDF